MCVITSRPRTSELRAFRRLRRAHSCARHVSGRHGDDRCAARARRTQARRSHPVRAAKRQLDAETMGRKLVEGVGWRYDIQHIAAQTRALRERGCRRPSWSTSKADGKSWPTWREKLGLRSRERAHRRAGRTNLRAAIGNPRQLSVTLTGHSGGGSLMFGSSRDRTRSRLLICIAFLDANYNFEQRRATGIVAWLRRNPRNRLVSARLRRPRDHAGCKKVVSDSGARGVRPSECSSTCRRR